MQLDPIIVTGNVVPVSDYTTEVGLIISKDMRRDQRVANVITRINKAINFMYDKCSNLPKRHKILIESQLLFSHFDYACSCSLGMTKLLHIKLQRQLNKGVRFIFSLPRHVDVKSYLGKLWWLSLEVRRTYFIFMQAFKVIKFQWPRYLYD